MKQILTGFLQYGEAPSSFCYMSDFAIFSCLSGTEECHISLSLIGFHHSFSIWTPPTL